MDNKLGKTLPAAADATGEAAIGAGMAKMASAGPKAGGLIGLAVAVAGAVFDASPAKDAHQNQMESQCLESVCLEGATEL